MFIDIIIFTGTAKKLVQNSGYLLKRSKSYAEISVSKLKKSRPKCKISDQ